VCECACADRLFPETIGQKTRFRVRNSSPARPHAQAPPPCVQAALTYLLDDDVRAVGAPADVGVEACVVGQQGAQLREEGAQAAHLGDVGGAKPAGGGGHLVLAANSQLHGRVGVGRGGVISGARGGAECKVG